MTSTESQVIELWNRGSTVQDIAAELLLEEEIVEDIIECQSNYLDMEVKNEK